MTTNCQTGRPTICVTVVSEQLQLLRVHAPDGGGGVELVHGHTRRRVGEHLLEPQGALLSGLGQLVLVGLKDGHHLLLRRLGHCVFLCRHRGLSAWRRRGTERPSEHNDAAAHRTDTGAQDPKVEARDEAGSGGVVADAQGRGLQEDGGQDREAGRGRAEVGEQRQEPGPRRPGALPRQRELQREDGGWSSSATRSRSATSSTSRWRRSSCRPSWSARPARS